MGMSIDESLEWLISRKEHYEMDDSCQELAQALDTAINTMRRYQKITEIVAHYRENVRDKVTNENMEKILEVVEE